jgi:hypothetical protein
MERRHMAEGQSPEEVLGSMKKSGYEYEMTIPRIDAETAAICIDNHSLAHSTGVTTGDAMTVCGVSLFAIKMKREIRHSQIRYA